MFELTQGESEFLVRLARRAITFFLKTSKKIPLPSNTPQKLIKNYGVFVTLKRLKNGVSELRGCTGYPEPILPLVKATIDSAINSATGDPRFPIISNEEMNDIIIEVSVLTRPQLIEVSNPIEYSNKIKIGRDGLLIQRGLRKGLLLPQVAIEWNWNEEEFLSNCSMKAGLQPDVWLLEGTKIYRFSCIIAQELTPNGEVIRKDLKETLSS